jgi:hypothetical protein
MKGRAASLHPLLNRSPIESANGFVLLHPPVESADLNNELISC